MGQVLHGSARTTEAVRALRQTLKRYGWEFNEVRSRGLLGKLARFLCAVQRTGKIE